MKVLARLLRFSLWRALLAIATGCVSGICAGSLVIFTQELVFGVEQLSPQAFLRFAGLAVAQFVARVVSQSELLRVLHEKALPGLRRDVAQSIVAAPLRTVEEIGPGRLMGALTGDSLSVGLGSMSWVSAAHSAFSILVCLASVARLSLTLLATLLGSIALGIGLFQVLNVFSRRYAARAQAARDALYGNFESLVSGTKELALNPARRRAFLDDGIGANVRAYHSLSALAASVNDFAAGWAGMLMFVLIGVLLFAWPHITAAPSGVQAAYVVAILYVQSELAALLGNVPRIVAGEIALCSILGLGLEIERPKQDVASPGTPAWRRLELLDVTHTYHREDHEDEFTLGPINMTLSPGEIVFVVGGNGSGKSTLGKLLVGLFTPEAGEIRIDDDAVTSENLEAYRSRFSAIFSDFFLFDRLYGLDGADAEARKHVARLKLSHKVEVEDGAFSTIDLSQGQRKRLALATALTEDRSIYLFDEWAADQDPAFKDVFYKELLPELKARGKTAVVITHDDRYFGCADRVLRVHEGRLSQA